MTRTGIKLDLDVGDFVSNAGRARGAIASLESEMEKAEKEGRMDDYGKLAFQKERLEARNTGFERDVKSLAGNPQFQSTNSNGATVLKMDAEYATVLKDLNTNLKKLYAKYDEALQSGDTVTAQGLFPEIDKTQGKISKTIEEANAPAMSKTTQGAIKAIGIGQIASAINEGFSRWAGSLDRSGIVNQYGSGDILGGRISEQRRQADLYGGIAQAGAGLAGAVIGTIIAPGVGTMLGGTIGGAVGKAADTGLHVGPNKDATEAAYTGLWQQRSAESMNLAALMEGPKQVREAFKIAADAAAEFGYSAEEGMDAIKQAAQQGLTGKKAVEAAKQVYQYSEAPGQTGGL
jgi:hypothetical protein